MLKGARLLHTQALHDGARSEIADRGEGHNFSQIENLKPDTQSLFCGFRCESFAPVRKPDAPSDFYARSEWKFCGRCAQADETYEVLSSFRFCGPETPASFFDQ